MPRKPDGDVAMSSTERVHRFRERQRAERGVGLTDRQKLNEALREIERLRQQGPPHAAPSHELAEALAEIERLRTELAQEKFIAHHARNEATALRDQVEKLKAKTVKQAKLLLDPESEVARQIASLKKKNKTLQQETDKWLMKVRSLVPAKVKAKVAKALTESTTSRENRLDALQEWNGCGLNNIGK